jgi:hypothetical protein
MAHKYRWLLVVAFVIVLIVIYYFSVEKKTQKTQLSYIDYDGDNYEGTASYLGDYDTMIKEKARRDSYARPTMLFKVNDRSNILKYERNEEGILTMIQTGRKYGKGAQVKVFKDSLMYPIVKNDNSFVELENGNYIKLKNISRV